LKRFSDKITHDGTAKEDSLAKERLWMFITTIEKASDVPHNNITKMKYTSVHKKQISGQQV